MRSLRLLILMSCILSAVACSSSKKGGGGDGDDGTGNIPLAEGEGVLKDINFDFDSSALSQSAKGTLNMNAEWLNANQESQVTVEGHCDERGTNEYNLALGDRRARSAYDYLRSLGVKADQMNTISYGEELPLDPGHDESAWAKNRRAHFSFRK